jgi:ureidoacrylate peracid hydrolase
VNVTAKPAVSVEMGTRPSQSWKVTPDAVDMTRPAPPVRPLAVAAQPQNITVDAAKSALLIVDMQNDFCTRGGWICSISARHCATPTIRAATSLASLSLCRARVRRSLR